ncbi:hypothetical protein KC336_g1 [Hortaea werneckii]|nr:hypothetical protein KC336_g1 [Hortaea werneckii]
MPTAQEESYRGGAIDLAPKGINVYNHFDRRVFPCNMIPLQTSFFHPSLSAFLVSHRPWLGFVRLPLPGAVGKHILRYMCEWGKL